VHWNGAAAILSRWRSIALQCANVRTVEEGNKRRGCRTANDHTWAVIDRRYRKDTCKAERELEKKIKIHKLKIKKRKKKQLK
jgi:hypothetical protein